MDIDEVIAAFEEYQYAVDEWRKRKKLFTGYDPHGSRFEEEMERLKKDLAKSLDAYIDVRIKVALDTPAGNSQSAHP